MKTQNQEPTTNQEQPSGNAPTQQKKSKKERRKYLLTLASLLFFIFGLAYFIYWFVELRHYQETDDAYVAGNQLQIMSQITGSVTHIYVDNTDKVNQGERLITLDDTDAKQAFDRAKTALANSVRQTHQLIINNKQLQANINLKKTALEQAQNDYLRRESLAKTAAIGKEELQHYRDAVETAKAALEVAIQQYNANQALVLNTPLEQQPTIQQAASQLRDAWLTLQRTNIVAPMEGYVSRRSVQIGARINAGTPLMVVVPTDQIWVDANFKETQLANMRIGQPATVISDFYGDDIVYQGKVVGLDMGTGSAFSLLPAQNATGNWIKVVQRLPVRIELNPQQIAEHPLRIGLSMRVKVDTAETDGAVLAEKKQNNAIYATNALTYDMAPVETLIRDIIHANTN